jgi:hypothetical protein
MKAVPLLSALLMALAVSAQDTNSPALKAPELKLPAPQERTVLDATLDATSTNQVATAPAEEPLLTLKDEASTSGLTLEERLLPANEMEIRDGRTISGAAVLVIKHGNPLDLIRIDKPASPTQNVIRDNAGRAAGINLFSLKF